MKKKFPDMPENVIPYYECYRDMGPERNINRVFHSMGKTPTYVSIKRWSDKYMWDARMVDELGAMGLLGDTIPEFDTASLNRKSLKFIDAAISTIQNRNEKTEKDASSLSKLIDLRVKVASKVDEIEEQDRVKLVRTYAMSIRDRLEERYRGASDVVETEGAG